MAGGELLLLPGVKSLQDQNQLALRQALWSSPEMFMMSSPWGQAESGKSFALTPERPANLWEGITSGA